MTLAFAMLSLPPMLFVLVYGHWRNEAAIVATLDSQLERTLERSIEAAAGMSATAVRVMAVVGDAVADGQVDIKSESSVNFLWRSLVAAERIDALYVSLEDGFHRVVTRIDDFRRRQSPQIPAAAQWHASYIDAISADGPRLRHRRFYASWPQQIGEPLDEPTTLDMRTTEHYVAAKQTGMLAVSEPVLNPDTGAPIVAIGWPILRHGRFIGFVGSNSTLSLVSTFLRDNRVSEHSITLITDGRGRIIANSAASIGPATVPIPWALKTMDELGDPRLTQALALLPAARLSRAPIRFTARTGEELIMAVKGIPSHYGKRWEILIIAPTNDFVGELRLTSRTVSMIGALLLVLELGVIFLLARRISRGIVTVSSQFKSVRELDLWAAPMRPSRIREVAELQSGFQLLLSALGSFAKFVPQGVVRQFVSAGGSIGPGVEPRPMTILFCDLEGFTTLSETLRPDALLHQLTQYFSAMTGAITQEQGTVDKFIGDAVMAFWGAPDAQADHALRACAAALRAKRRMEALYQSWAAEARPPLRLRIGLHTAEVLVGNIGSAERLSYTAIGDGVNVSSRLEGVNKIFGTTICISGSLQSQLSTRLVARPLRPIQVKGRRQEIMIFELLGFTGTDDPELAASSEERELAQLSTEAVSRRMQGDLQGCIELYRILLARHPADQVTRALLAEIETASGPASGPTSGP